MFSAAEAGKDNSGGGGGGGGGGVELAVLRSPVHVRLFLLGLLRNLHLLDCHARSQGHIARFHEAFLRGLRFQVFGKEIELPATLSYHCTARKKILLHTALASLYAPCRKTGGGGFMLVLQKLNAPQRYDERAYLFDLRSCGRNEGCSYYPSHVSKCGTMFKIRDDVQNPGRSKSGTFKI